jgi:hypothetical protein
MSIDDASAWADRERELFAQLEREFPGTYVPPPATPDDGRYPDIPRWSAVLMTLSLLAADGLLLAMAARSGAVVLYALAVLLFALAFVPQLRPGRSGQKPNHPGA